MTKPKNLDIQLDWQNLLASSVGEEHGLSDSDLREMEKSGRDALEALQKQKKAGNLQFTELPYQEEIVDSISKKTQELKGKYRNLVVLGIGGSALGTLALAEALLPSRYPLIDPHAGTEWPRLFVLDNVDPEGIGEIMERLNPEETLYNVVSKSGSTAEVMAQFLVFLKEVKEHTGTKWKDHLVITTDAENGALRQIAHDEKILSFAIPQGVGGRFSVMTPVGLFPAALAGLDVKELLRGAAAMDERCGRPDPSENPALFGALASHLMDRQKGKSITVLFSYSQALRLVSDWFCQLWAESLGKKVNLNGEKVHCGQTPVRALGVTDQHSQVQLYTEGPNDKMFTFLAVQNFRRHVTIPESPYEFDSLSYLGGKSLNELFDAERRGTVKALTTASRPNCTITFPEVSAYTLGQTLFLFMVQTAIAGILYNINAFDQPGVEAGKIATYALLGRKGFEGKF